MTTIALIEQYILLITQFVTGVISAPQFEQSYLDMFKHESNELPEHVYEVLNGLFSDVDAYCGDPYLRDEDDLDDDQLIECAKAALERLCESSDGARGH